MSTEQGKNRDAREWLRTALYHLSTEGGGPYSRQEIKAIVADLLGRKRMPKPSRMTASAARDLVRRLIVLGLA